MINILHRSEWLQIHCPRFAGWIGDWDQTSFVTGIYPIKTGKWTISNGSFFSSSECLLQLYDMTLYLTEKLFYLIYSFLS